SEEHTSELQSLTNLVCRLLLEKKNDAMARLSLAASAWLSSSIGSAGWAIAAKATRFENIRAPNRIADLLGLIRTSTRSLARDRAGAVEQVTQLSRRCARLNRGSPPVSGYQAPQPRSS